MTAYQKDKRKGFFGVLNRGVGKTFAGTSGQHPCSTVGNFPLVVGLGVARDTAVYIAERNPTKAKRLGMSP